MLDGMGTDSDLVRQYLEHRGLIFGFIHALTRDLDAAEDAFQEVGLRVVEQAAKGTPVGKFLPWVREIARNVVADHFRRRSRAPLPATIEALVVRAFEENELGGDDIRARRRYLSECLSRLTDKVRELFRLRYGEGAPLDDAASAVGWRPDSVKVAMSRARKSLLDCMQAKLRATEA